MGDQSTNVEMVDMGDKKNSKAGKVVRMLVFNSANLKASHIWKILIQALVGLLEAMLVSAFMMTWIFHYFSDTFSILLSIMQFPIFFGAIFSLIIIPIEYSRWTNLSGSKAPNGDQVRKSRKVLIVYICLELLICVLAVANIIVRVVYFFPLPVAGDARTVNLALFYLTIVSGVVALMGVIFGALLRSALASVSFQGEGELNGDTVVSTDAKYTRSQGKSTRKVSSPSYSYKKDDVITPDIYETQDSDFDSKASAFINVSFGNLNTE